MSNKEVETAPAGLLEQYREDARQRRRAAVEQYRELLLRSDAPRDGDARALAKVMDTLGRAETDLAQDIELVESLARAEALAAELDQRDTDRKTTHAAQAEVLAWAESERGKLEAALTAKLEAAEAKCRVAGDRFREAAQAKTDLGSLVDRWDSIVTGRSLDEIRSARRAARHAASMHGPPGPTREEVIAERRHETVVLRLHPVDGTPEGMVKSVNAALAAAGYEALSDEEIKQYGVAGWLTR